MIVYARQLYTPTRLSTMTNRMNNPSGGKLTKDHMFKRIIGHHWKMKTTMKINIILAELLYRSAFASVTFDFFALRSLITIPPYAAITAPNTDTSTMVENSAYTFPALVRRSSMQLSIWIKNQTQNWNVMESSTNIARISDAVTVCWLWLTDSMRVLRKL